VCWNLCSNYEKPRGEKGDAASVKGFNNVNDANSVWRPGPESASGIGEHGNQHVLLHVKRTRVEGEAPGTEPGDCELGLG